MKLSTAQQLAALNLRFYNEHAENFADSRPRLAAGVLRALAEIGAGARVLEVGCGDGKVGRALARAGVGMYLGLDASEAMLERAREYTTKDRFARPHVGARLGSQLPDLPAVESWRDRRFVGHGHDGTVQVVSTRKVSPRRRPRRGDAW